MIGQVLVSAAILTLQVPEATHGGKQPAAAPKTKATENPGEALARYEQMRQKTPQTAAA
jgi:hypothetical protein